MENYCQAFLDISHFITKPHSSFCSFVDHQFGLRRPSCHLELQAKRKADKHEVSVTQAALGGTLTSLEIHCKTGVSVFSSVSVCVCMLVRQYQQPRLCVYMAEFPMMNVVRTSSRLGNVHKKDTASSTLLLFFLCKHVLPISLYVCVCAFSPSSFALLQCH